MKRLLLLLILLCIGGEARSYAQSIKLPAECKKILNNTFRGWELASIKKEINDYHRKMKFSFAPNLVKGDWNGDGKIDYAVLIKKGRLKNSQGEVIGDPRFTLLFVKTKKSFKSFRFEGSDYIHLMKKGTKDYDYKTNKTFRYKNDTVFDGFWEKGGVSYVWKNGKFLKIVTSD